MTQLECAGQNKLTALMRAIAKDEEIKPAQVLAGIRQGRIVILNNKLRDLQKPCAVGSGLRTKVNANIGTSTDKTNLANEFKKLNAALSAGADAVMDLSVGGNLSMIRRKILAKTPVPLGTVPIYEIAVNADRKSGDNFCFGSADVFEVLEEQAREGVDFFTIHAGVTRETVGVLKKHRRLLGIVSRGAAILAAWMRRNNKENPFYEHFDRVIDIAGRFDITLSLGDGLRPGSIFDASDAAQFSELRLLGKLAARARKRGVQVIIEGPGHVQIDQIRQNMLLEKKHCGNAPFYVLGPLVTDVASGWDHVNSAIGSAIAAANGADFLCYVTASEHLRHPDAKDVYEGVIVSRIAAHAADLVKGVRTARMWDWKMSAARARRDWKQQIKLSIDPLKAAAYRKSSLPRDSEACTMCGKYCSIKLNEMRE